MSAKRLYSPELPFPYRILYRAPDAGEGAWVELAPAKGRVVLRFFERRLLPEIGQARLEYHYGEIDGVTVGYADAPELLGQEIRIQQSEPIGPEEVYAWRTVWRGRCEQQIESDTALITYVCEEYASRWREWVLDRIQWYDGGTGTIYDSAGVDHPGFNRHLQGGAGRVIGTNSGADPNGLGFDAHAWPGADTSQAWTDQDVIAHVINSPSTRPSHEPLLRSEGSMTSVNGPDDTIILRGPGMPAAHELLRETNAWEVPPGTTTLDLLGRVLSRSRGRGTSHVGWIDDIDNPDGPLQLELRVWPQQQASLAWSIPEQSYDPVDEEWDDLAVTLTGATVFGTALSIDLSGDQILAPGSVQVSDWQPYSELITEGEPLRVVVTLAYEDGSLAARWIQDEETAFTGAAAIVRKQRRWAPVFRDHSLPLAWDFKAKDGNGNKNSSGVNQAGLRCDYRCNDSGGVISPTGDPDTPTGLVQFQGSVPLHEGWKYSTEVPTRWDGVIPEYMPPERPCALYIRRGYDADADYEDTGSDRRGRFSFESQAVLYVRGDTLTAGGSGDEINGSRLIGDPDAGVGSRWAYEDLVLTVSMTYGRRLRMRSTPGTAPPVQRAKRIQVPGVHLWLVHPLAIWDIDNTQVAADDDNSDAYGWPALRSGVGGLISSNRPGALRDDRKMLGAKHYLAAEWYLKEHRSCQWTWLTSALQGFWVQRDGTVTAYPGLGTVIDELTWPVASGQSRTVTIDAPVSTIRWDQDRQATTFACDWPELDL